MSAYRKALAYRTAKQYRGLAVGPPVPAPSIIGGVRMPWTQEAERAASTRVPFVDPAHRHASDRMPWSAEAPGARGTGVPFRAPNHRGVATALPFDQADAADPRSTALPFAQRRPQNRVHALPWAETSERLSVPTRARYAQRRPQDRAHALPWGELVARGGTSSLLWRALAQRGAFVALPWGPSGQYHRDYRAPYPVEPNPGDPGADPITVPTLPVYFMIPTLTAVVLPARTPLDLLTFSVTTDAARAGWQCSASLPIAALPLVNPADAEDPVDIEVTVNGYTWILAVTGFADRRRLGSRTATIEATSRSIVLADPLAPKSSRDQPLARNASQLGDEELAGTGWTLVWDAVDWLVPGGTWSYADLAPLEALGALAAAIGARVETNRTTLGLRVAPTYPVSPWAWAAETPYAILPASILTVSDGGWQPGPNANGVYIYGESGGYRALVKLTGTAGEVPLPMVVDKLITHADPARERGRHELAASSRIKRETVSIPLFPTPADPGLLPIGALIDVQESATLTWRGQVVGVRIDASRSGSAFSVRQVLQVERHFR